MAVAHAGGGAKKILYTLATVQKIGVAKAAKALTAHNTCKACALGMGGQAGGMTSVSFRLSATSPFRLSPPIFRMRSPKPFLTIR